MREVRLKSFLYVGQVLFLGVPVILRLSKCVRRLEIKAYSTLIYFTSLFFALLVTVESYSFRQPDLKPIIFTNSNILRRTKM